MKKLLFLLFATALTLTGYGASLDINGDFADNADESSFVSLLVLDGEGKLECCGETLDLIKGDSIFIPANAGEYKLQGKLEIIETRI